MNTHNCTMATGLLPELHPASTRHSDKEIINLFSHCSFVCTHFYERIYVKEASKFEPGYLPREVHILHMGGLRGLSVFLT